MKTYEEQKEQIDQLVKENQKLKMTEISIRETFKLAPGESL